MALILRDWLPDVLQSIVPYVSSEDIDKGKSWEAEIAKELDCSNYGILCLTKENINEPWINFEAGALSKQIGKSFVSPFLLNVGRSEVSEPVQRFQSTIFDKADVRKLIASLNKSCVPALSEDRVNKMFSLLYPRLEEELKSLLQMNKGTGMDEKAMLKTEKQVAEQEKIEIDREAKAAHAKMVQDHHDLKMQFTAFVKLTEENNSLKTRLEKLEKESAMEACKEPSLKVLLGSFSADLKRPHTEDVIKP